MSQRHCEQKCSKIHGAVWIYSSQRPAELWVIRYKIWDLNHCGVTVIKTGFCPLQFLSSISISSVPNTGIPRFPDSQKRWFVGISAGQPVRLSTPVRIPTALDQVSHASQAVLAQVPRWSSPCLADLGSWFDLGPTSWAQICLVIPGQWLTPVTITRPALLTFLWYCGLCLIRDRVYSILI